MAAMQTREDLKRLRQYLKLHGSASRDSVTPPSDDGSTQEPTTNILYNTHSQTANSTPKFQNSSPAGSPHTPHKKSKTKQKIKNKEHTV
jgi:hypothetical protein